MAATTLRTNRDHVRPETLEQYRRELTGYCYRMLGCGIEAEDAVQETMLRAVRARHTFEGRSSVRSWLYQIATNICLDQLRDRSRRAWPIGLSPPSEPDPALVGVTLPESAWVWPIHDAQVLSPNGDPAEIAAVKETIRLAFVTALQHLSARQRAALVLCKVLRFEAAEAAEMLGTTAAAVNSALKRANAKLAALPMAERAVNERSAGIRADHAELLNRYVDAFERYDICTLVGLLHKDAVQTMPPFTMWLQGSANIGVWMTLSDECRGSRLLATAANGCPALAQYRAHRDGGHAAWALQVLEISDGRVTGLHYFLRADRLFRSFGLPARLPA
jgi:RNA polymerase sigma-70 factor, ECF subfamily